MWVKYDCLEPPPHTHWLPLALSVGALETQIAQEPPMHQESRCIQGLKGL